MTALIRWFRSPKVGVVSFRVRKQMSYSASLSRICTPQASSLQDICVLMSITYQPQAEPCLDLGSSLLAVVYWSAQNSLQVAGEVAWGLRGLVRRERTMHSSAFSTSWCTDRVAL